MARHPGLVVPWEPCCGRHQGPTFHRRLNDADLTLAAFRINITPCLAERSLRVGLYMPYVSSKKSARLVAQWGSFLLPLDTRCISPFPRKDRLILASFIVEITS